MRTSSYVIYVDLPGRPDKVLLVHGYTGAYDLVSRGVADYLKSQQKTPVSAPLHGAWTEEPALEERPPAEVPCETTLLNLRKRGYLTELSPTDEEQVLCVVVEKMHQSSLANSPTYILMPTYDCNLRCGYCFQSHMRTKAEFRYLLRTMTPETADLVLAAMLKIESLRPGANGTDGKGITGPRSVTFFGGEPLLAESRAIVERLIVGVQVMGPADIGAVTNATELDAYDDLLGPKAISWLQITLDGPPEEHDRRRIYPDGSGSFAQIASNMDRALEKGCRVTVRINVDRKNIHELPALATAIRERGWNQHRNFSVYAAPIRSHSDGRQNEADVLYTLAPVGKPATSHIVRHGRDKGEMNSWELHKALGDMCQLHPECAVIRTTDDTIGTQARSLFDSSGSGTPRLLESFCGAHTNMYIFDAFRDIYMCWELTGDPDIRAGRVLDNGDVEFRADVVDTWRTRTVASNPVCRRCRYALHCGGGCAVLAYGRSGELHSNFCDGFGLRFRAATADAYLQPKKAAVDEVLGSVPCR